MCGRYNVIDDERVRDLLDLLGVNARMHTAFNIAPTDDIQIVQHDPDSGHNRLRHARWWLIPGWLHEPDTRYSMFNARAETLATSRAFRAPFRHQRCVIPATSFIEWQLRDGRKYPLEIAAQHQALAFAGIWDRWGEGPETIYSCALITTQATAEFEPIHARQPVMLPYDALEQWLNPDIDGETLMPLLFPQLPCDLTATEVDPRINNSHRKEVPQPLALNPPLTLTHS